jgi:hypothetical protein
LASLLLAIGEGVFCLKEKSALIQPRAFGAKTMWWSISTVAYIILLIFGLLFVMGANARTTPPVSNRSRLKPERVAAGPDIAMEEADSGILAGCSTSAGAPTRRAASR